MNKYGSSLRWFTFLLLLHLVSGSADVLAFDTDYDFGTDGRVIADLEGESTRAHAVLIDPDGNILVGGSVGTSPERDFALLRFTPDGEPDGSFLDGGTVITSVGIGNDEIQAMAFTAEGRIVTAGYRVDAADKDFALACYNSDGTLYEGFGTGGILLETFSNLDDEILAVAVDSNGRIVVGGYATGTGGRFAVLMRYLDNGLIDNSFGVQGSLYFLDAEIFHDLKVLDDNRIVATGTHIDENGLERAVVIRVSADGQLDESFGELGIAYPDESLSTSRAEAVSILANGSILVAGSVGKEGSLDSALFGFTADGAIDADFGEQGLLNIGLTDIDDAAFALVVRENKIGVAGYSLATEGRDFLFILARDLNAQDVVASGSRILINNLQVRSSLLDKEDLLPQTASTSHQWDISAITTPLGYNDYATAAALVSADEMLAVGITDQEENEALALVRYIVDDAAVLVGGGVAGGSPWGLAISAPNYTEVPNAWFITTRAVTSITQTSAVSGGAIQSAGELTVNKRGVVFGINPDPLYPSTDSNENATDTEPASTVQNTASSGFITTGYTENGSGIGNYYSEMKELRPGTTYYVRAYARSDEGDIYYGNTIRFETSEACFIATAAFGSVLDPHVGVLRDFRDRYLLPTALGTRLVDFYYRVSPSLADTIVESGFLRFLTRLALLPIIALSWLALHPPLMIFTIFLFACLVTVIRQHWKKRAARMLISGI